MFITLLVAVFSILSGYFTVLIYEYAAAATTDKAIKTQITAKLNISFQVRLLLYTVYSVVH